MSAGETFVRAASICELFLASKRERKRKKGITWKLIRGKLNVFLPILGGKKKIYKTNVYKIYIKIPSEMQVGS